MNKMILASLLSLTAATAHADMANELQGYVGYKIISTKTIAGYEDSGKERNDFRGCTVGRKIIFTDRSTLTCAGNQYQRAYRPQAVILSNGSGYKVFVTGNNNAFDMR